MTKGKMFSGKRLWLWLLALLFVLALGFYFFKLLAPLKPCPEPTALTVVNTDTTELSVRWQGSSDALEYRLSIRDSSDLAVALQDTVLTDTSYTFRNLQPDHAYAISVNAVCQTSTSNETQVGARTMPSIIIEDITHYEGPECPSSCLDTIALDNNCTDWALGAGLEFYRIDIYSDSHISGPPSVRHHFIKHRYSDPGDLYIWTGIDNCAVLSGNIGGQPSQCPSPRENSLCGTITAGSDYRVDFTHNGFCLQIPDGYFAVVIRCTTNQ